jgi:hypothetical protein
VLRASLWATGDGVFGQPVRRPGRPTNYTRNISTTRCISFSLVVSPVLVVWLGGGFCPFFPCSCACAV